MLCTIYSKTIRSNKEKASILDLEELVARFQNDERRRRTVEALRAKLPTLPPSSFWQDIERLPRICPGLLLKRRRNGEVHTTYTGVVLLEVGGLTEAGEVERVKARAAGWPTTLAAFMGASGQTVKILVSGTLDDGTLPKEPASILRFHQRLYEMSTQAYVSVIGRPLKTKDARPDNTFYWTYDANPFLNTTAAPIRILRYDILQTDEKGDLQCSRNIQDTVSGLQAYLRAHYDLRFNELTNCVEWRSNDSASYTFLPLDSRMMNTMIQEAHESGLKIADRDMKRFLGSTRVRSYHAARAYLHNIRGHWDGRTDYIGQLADRIPTSNQLWRKYFHQWFLNLVAQWDSPGEGHSEGMTPLIIGPRDCGKSTFAKLLLPPELRDIGYRELADFTSKAEVERQLRTSLLIHLNEISQPIGKISQRLLKDVLQKSTIRGRRPYSNEIQELPCFASSIATTSTTAILTDAGCLIRFFVVELRNGKHIDTSSPLPYPQLYAQAVTELEAKERPYHFTSDLLAELEIHNSRYTSAPVEVLRFLETFALATVAGKGMEKMKLSDITDAVRRHTGYSYSDKSFNYLGRWLTREARMQHVRKTVSNGSPHYLLKPLY